MHVTYIHAYMYLRSAVVLSTPLYLCCGFALAHSNNNNNNINNDDDDDHDDHDDDDAHDTHTHRSLNTSDIR